MRHTSHDPSHTTAHVAAHRATTRTAHRRTRHASSRRLARSRRPAHHPYAHSRRIARLHHSRRRRPAAAQREAVTASRGTSSAASALALTLASPAFAHVASPSVPHLAHPALAAAADIPPVPRETPLEAASFHPERIVPTPPLRGTFASLERQNQRTLADGLERILNNTDLNNRIARGFLVRVPTSADLTVNDRLPLNHRYCRPWTADFLADLARAHQAEFHHPLEVSSAVRTIDYQKRLERINGNAASAVGEIVSPHVTGAAIDITKKGLNTREIYWMRIVLRDLQDQGVIDVEEEFHQACFHITVYKSYLSRNALRQTRRRELDTEASSSSSSS
ncbi:MAG TPA: DUF5715 family protein [Terracidiphilus sp.]|nr:DUF5715 family protein [Terracidiphilus sp.]